MWIGSFQYDGKEIFFGTTSSGGTTKLCDTKEEAAMILAKLENEDGHDISASEAISPDVTLCQRLLKGSEDLIEGCVILQCPIPGDKFNYLVFLETGFVFLAAAETLEKAIAYAKNHWEF